jgi:polyhydroxybutyrate depolymerase
MPSGRRRQEIPASRGSHLPRVRRKRPVPSTSHPANLRPPASERRRRSASRGHRARLREAQTTAIKSFDVLPKIRTASLLIAVLLGIAPLAVPLAVTAPAIAQSWQVEQRAVRVGAEERTYLLHVPPGVARPASVVMVFHGGGGRADAIMQATRFNDIADQNRFIVVYPQGIGRWRGGTWNIASPDSPSSADDTGFVRAILADLEHSFPIDRRRIYATGESMGGVFSYRLACEMSDVFAAVAPVAATMVEPRCVPRSPVAVLHVHGSADENIPLGGGAGSMTARGRSWPPMQGGIRQWAAIDGCTPEPKPRQDGPETTCYSYPGCRAAVEYCVVNGGGHAWPGGVPHPWQQRFGIYVSQTFPASARIWAFFATHPKG